MRALMVADMSNGMVSHVKSLMEMVSDLQHDIPVNNPCCTWRKALKHACSCTVLIGLGIACSSEVGWCAEQNSCV